MIRQSSPSTSDVTLSPCTRSGTSPVTVPDQYSAALNDENRELCRFQSMIVRGGNRVAALVQDYHELVGLTIRQRAEQHTVHDAEDRRRRADPECECYDRDRR